MFIYVNIGQGYFEVAPVFLWYTQPHKKECERGRKNREWLPVNRPALKAPPRTMQCSLFSQGEQLKKTLAWGRGKHIIRVQQNVYRPSHPQHCRRDKLVTELEKWHMFVLSRTGSFWGRKELELSNSFAHSVSVYWGLVVCQLVVLSLGIQPGQRRPKENKTPNKQTKAHKQRASIVMEIDRH